jgi:hypothetical protein
VSPFSRSEIGTAATIDCRGSSRRAPSQRRSAELHSISTMSLSVAPWARPSARSSGSGRLTAAKLRPRVTDTFSGVLGASARFFSPLPPNSSVPASTWVAASLSVPTVDGSSRTMWATFCAWLPMTPRSISTISSSNTRLRPEGRPGDSPRHRTGVEDGVGQRHRRLAVDRGMVQLRIDRDASHATRPGCQALEDVEFPQRARTIQKHAVQAPHLGLHLGHAGGPAVDLGQADFHHMGLHVGLGIDPRRGRQVQRHPPGPAPQRRGHRQAAGHVLHAAP